MPLPYVALGFLLEEGLDFREYLLGLIGLEVLSGLLAGLLVVVELFPRWAEKTYMYSSVFSCGGGKENFFVADYLELF